MTIIGMKELRTNTEEITRRVQAGERFRVVSRSKPLFDIVPLPDEPTDTTAMRESVRSIISQHRKAFEALADQ